MAWLRSRDSNGNQDEGGGSALKRLSHVLALTAGVIDEDPDEVEARLRNLFHGSNRDSYDPEYLPQ